MNSEPKSPSASRLFRQLMQRRNERLCWEMENPELAHDWNEAWQEDELREAEKQAAENGRRWHAAMPARLAKMGCPAFATSVVVGTQRETVATRAAAEFERSSAIFLVLTGGPGTGKTVAACSILRNLAPADGIFIRAAELAGLSQFGADAERWRDVCEKKFLVVDDLGAEHKSDWWKARLDELIDRRYGGKLKTCVTTNLDVKQFSAHYELPRVVDRIIQTGKFIDVGKNSMRRETKK